MKSSQYFLDISKPNLLHDSIFTRFQQRKSMKLLTVKLYVSKRNACCDGNYVVFRALAEHGFGFESRGKIDVKGKGPMTTYFLESAPFARVPASEESSTPTTTTHVTALKESSTVTRATALQETSTVTAQNDVIQNGGDLSNGNADGKSTKNTKRAERKKSSLCRIA